MPTLVVAGAVAANGQLSIPAIVLVTLIACLLGERCTSLGAAAMLRRIKGIGPGTEALILLCGLGRLQVFPANDTGIASDVALVAGSAPLDVQHVLDTLGSERGMLYYHLVLARLDARNELGRQSFVGVPPSVRHPRHLEYDSEIQ